MYEQLVTSNQNKQRRRALAVALGLVGVVAITGLALLIGASWPVALAVAVVVVGAGVALANAKADAVALRVSRAQPADDDTYPRYHNVVEGLCVASGLNKPQLYVVDDPAPNAFAAGRDPRQAALVVTTGLLEKLDRIELEGVLAHELAHIKNEDILVSTSAVTLVGLVTILADLGIRTRWWGMGRTAHREHDRRHEQRRGPWRVLAIPGYVLLAFAPIVARLMRLAVNRRREVVADVLAVQMTRYPPGLIAALEKLRADSTVVASASHGTAHLWLNEPAAQDPGQGRLWRVNRMFVNHPPLEERIALLQEL